MEHSIKDMNENLKKELNKNRFFIVRYGLFFILLTAGLILLSLTFIQIEEKSILEMVIKYYLR